MISGFLKMKAMHKIIGKKILLALIFTELALMPYAIFMFFALDKSIDASISALIGGAIFTYSCTYHV